MEIPLEVRTDLIYFDQTKEWMVVLEFIMLSSSYRLILPVHAIDQFADGLKLALTDAKRQALDKQRETNGLVIATEETIKNL